MSINKIRINEKSYRMYAPGNMTQHPAFVSFCRNRESGVGVVGDGCCKMTISKIECEVYVEGVSFVSLTIWCPIMLFMVPK